MRQICILGCSHTEGAELPDSTLFENYWDFLKYDSMEYMCRPIILQDYSDHMLKIYNMYDGDMEKYNIECRKLSWTATLRKNLNGINIIDHSKGGTGIDFFHYLYLCGDSLKEENHSMVLDRKDIKKDMLDSELLIWQLTDEPRYFISIKDTFKNVLSVNLGHLKAMLKLNDIEKWRGKIILNYYENCFDEDRYLKEKIEFLNYIATQRTLLKKKTIFFSFFKTEMINRGLNPVDTKWVKWLGFDDLNNEGMVMKFVNEGIIAHTETYSKFRHSTVKVQKLVGEYISNYIKTEGIMP